MSIKRMARQTVAAGLMPDVAGFSARENLLTVIGSSVETLLSESDADLLTEARAAAIRQARSRDANVGRWANKLALDLSKLTD